jgi:hypothetical protein
VTELSQQQLEQVSAALYRASVRLSCQTCSEGTLEIDRALYALEEVTARSPHGAPEGQAPPRKGRALCVVLSCERCGYMRLHSLAALGLDQMA